MVSVTRRILRHGDRRAQSTARARKIATMDRRVAQGPVAWRIATGPARVSRRDLIPAGAAAGVIALAPRAARAQPKPAEPPSVITTPPRDFGPNAPPNVYFVDPDVLTVDPSFNGLRQVNAPIQRLWTGALWSEGPAWSGQGRYLVWSDIPNNRQMRWLEDNGRVSVFRMPSNNSNGK